jgi:capsular polysaccharide biosynthesis protein
MELDRYLRALVQRWYVVVVLLGVGVLGTWVYFHFTEAATATSLVAVLEPAASKGDTGGQQVQLNFASIAESRVVAQRVIDRLHLNVDAQQLSGNVSVKVSSSLIPSLTMPLYSVQVKDRDPAQAILLNQTVVDEATQVFLQLNTLKPAAVNSALQQQEDQLRQQAEKARTDLENFEQQNKAYNLDTQIQAQTALVTGLRQAVDQNYAGQMAAATSHGDVTDASKSVDAELTRLESLQPDYDRLTFDVNLAAGEVSQLSGRESDMAVADANLAVADANTAATLGAVRSELATARSRLATARAALASFRTTNGVDDLNAAISNRIAQLSDLRRQEMLTASPPPNTSDLLPPEQQELDRLMSLEPEYQRLAAAYSSANALVTTLEGRKFDLIVSSIVPADAQVKVLDSAYVQPDTFFMIILYALGAVLGLCLGLAAVYVIGYFDRTPYDVSDVQALYREPQLVVPMPSAY